jgi:glutathione S-transferase
VPAEAQAAARVDQIVGIVDWYVFPSITVGITAERLMAQIFWGRATDEANIAKALPTARTCIRELERLQGTADFVAGDRLSIADLMLAPQLEFFRATPEGAELLKGTSLDSWLTRMSLRASMQATQVERLRQTA